MTQLTRIRKGEDSIIVPTWEKGRR